MDALTTEDLCCDEPATSSSCSSAWAAELMRKAATAATATAGGAHADSPQLLSRRQEVAVLKLVQKAAECVSSPPEAAFVQLGGEPGPPSAGQQGAAQQFRDDAAAGLRLARALVAVAEPALQLRGPSSSDDQDGRGASRGGSDELGGSGAAPRTVTHGVQIEELPNDGVDVSDAELKIQAEAAVDAALLACAAHLADPALAAPWSSCGTEVAAAGLLDELVRRVTMVRPPYRRLSAVEGSLAMMSPGDVKMQDLLCARLPALLPALRAMLGHQQRHDLNSRPFKPYAGPNAYQRCLVARRLSRLVRCLTHPFIGSQVTMLLPAVLAVLDDPSAAVARHGIVALRHCAAQALGADLRWQRELLLQVCHQLVVGCRDELWADALPAAAELAVAVEGPDPRASGYHDLLPEMLTEVERTAHVAQRRCVFMAAATPLVAAMGLAAVRHFGRLMPLVLEWLHAVDAKSRAAAAGLLAAVIRATWPRLVGAGTAGHDAVLWAHLQETRAAEARQAQPSREVLDEVEAACQLLRDAGGGTVSPLAAA